MSLLGVICIMYTASPNMFFFECVCFFFCNNGRRCRDMSITFRAVIVLDERFNGIVVYVRHIFIHSLYSVETPNYNHIMGFIYL